MLIRPVRVQARHTTSSLPLDLAMVNIALLRSLVRTPIFCRTWTMSVPQRLGPDLRDAMPLVVPPCPSLSLRSKKSYDFDQMVW